MEKIIQQIAAEWIEKILEKVQQTHLDLSELCGMLLEDCKQTACRIVEACIQETNRTLREEKSWRKQQGLVLKEKDWPRRVLSEIGELPFQRGYYRDRLREEYVIPMDQLPGISAYERLLSSVGAELVHKATEFSYAKSAELVTGGAVTRQTVRNQIGKCRIPKWKPEQEKRAVRELHLFADEDHVPLQRPGKQKGKWNQQVPLVLVTEGVRPISGKRSQSIHPKYFVEETFDTGKLWKEVSGYLSQTYETGELERIWVHGDGGGWIRNGLEEFAQTRHVMDGFHWERELKRFSRKFPKKNVKQRIRQVLKKNDKEKAAEILKEVGKTEENKEETDRFGKYLMRNWDRIRARQEKSIPGSCAEGQISHVLSERFSRNPMGWSRETLGKLSAIRIYEKNGGRISGKDLRGEKEEKEGYGEYAEKILEESVKGSKDWSLFEKEKNWSFDLASGTQQVIHMLGENRGWLY